MGKASLLIYLTLFALLVLSQCANIDQTLGGNPTFFNLSEQSNLEILNNSNLTSDEKFYLLFHNNLRNASLPSNIEDYNLMMNFSCAPYDAKIYNKNYIKDAWVKVITVLPSIHEINKTWSLPAGKAITSFDYNIAIPRSATNFYPDCGST